MAERRNVSTSEYEYEEYRDPNIGFVNPPSNDILPTVDSTTNARNLERVRRWIDRFVAIRGQRAFNAHEIKAYQELCTEEARLLALRGPVYPEPDTCGIDREPQPGDGPDYAEEHLAWERRQLERVRRQFAADNARDQLRLNAAVFGGVPAPDPDFNPSRTTQAAWDNLQATLGANLVEGRNAMRAQQTIRRRALTCSACGEPTLGEKPCPCDTVRHGRTPGTFAMDMLEIDWAADGLTFAGALRDENARRRCNNGGV